jgi:hypothetical protein
VGPDQCKLFCKRKNIRTMVSFALVEVEYAAEKMDEQKIALMS